MKDIKENFSAKAYKQELKDKGVFHTDTKLADILKKYGKEEPKNIYDPTCGTGTLLSVYPDEIPKYGQELDAQYLNVAKTRLKNFTGYVGDTLKEPAFMDMKFDLIVANYPFSISWEQKQDERFKNYALAPKSKADYAFILHMLHLLEDDGVIVTLAFPGILYRGNSEGKIRKQLIEQGNIKRIVQVQGKYFEDTNIATVIIVLTKTKNEKIIFEDLQLEKEIEVSIQEIIDNDYKLSVNNYLYEEEEKEEFDVEYTSNFLRKCIIDRIKSHLDTEALIGKTDIKDFIKQIKQALDEWEKTYDELEKIKKYSLNDLK